MKKLLFIILVLVATVTQGAWGQAASGRLIWRWTGPATSEPQPVEIIFTNHDLLTDIMPFDNGGYYNYGKLLYNAEQTTGIQAVGGGKLTSNGGWYNLLGHKLQDKPIERGVYIHNGDKMMIK